MNRTATARIGLLASVLLFSHTVHADAALDATIMDHVMPRFEQEAREFMAESGAQLVSSRWDGDTHTLIAVGDLPPPPAKSLDVAFPASGRAPQAPPASDHVARLCRHPGAAMLAGFMAKHDITMVFVYRHPNTRLAPQVVDIDHTDLGGCI